MTHLADDIAEEYGYVTMHDAITALADSPQIGQLYIALGLLSVTADTVFGDVSSPREAVRSALAEAIISARPGGEARRVQQLLDRVGELACEAIAAERAAREYRHLLHAVAAGESTSAETQSALAVLDRRHAATLHIGHETV